MHDFDDEISNDLVGIVYIYIYIYWDERDFKDELVVSPIGGEQIGKGMMNTRLDELLSTLGGQYSNGEQLRQTGGIDNISIH